MSSNHTLGKLYILALFLMLFSCKPKITTKDDVFNYLRSFGNGSYMFGQVATWVHNENPDMDHDSNWLKKIYDHSGKMPRYGVITYDFTDDPFPDSAWNIGVKKMWDRGLIVGVYSFFANPCGLAFREFCDIDPIFESGTNPTKAHFYNHLTKLHL